MILINHIIACFLCVSTLLFINETNVDHESEGKQGCVQMLTLLFLSIRNQLVVLALINNPLAYQLTLEKWTIS